MEFEPTTPAFAQGKTVHVFYCADAATGQSPDFILLHDLSVHAFNCAGAAAGQSPDFILLHDPTVQSICQT
jgi:urease alpha subunit